MRDGLNDILFTRVTHRGDTGTAPIYMIGGILFFTGLVFIFGFAAVNIGLMLSGIGLVMIGVREKPRLSFRWVKYSGPPGLALFLTGLLLFTHII